MGPTGRNGSVVTPASVDLHVEEAYWERYGGLIAQAYPGQWVVIMAEVVVFHHHDEQEVVRFARENVEPGHAFTSRKCPVPDSMRIKP